jgi:bacterioferritin-associated ferredoxin
VIVCHCFAVNDRRIAEHVAAGARTLKQISRACRAGTDCGGCVPLIAELLRTMSATVYELAPDEAAAVLGSPSVRAWVNVKNIGPMFIQGDPNTTGPAHFILKLNPNTEVQLNFPTFAEAVSRAELWAGRMENAK